MEQLNMTQSLDLTQLRDDLQKAGSPWQMDPGTSMARLTEDERRIRLGFTPSPDDLTLEDAVKQDATASQEPLVKSTFESLGLPAKYCLDNVGGKNFTTPVKDQGGCGSCVAFGTAAVLETTYKKQHNKPNFNLNLSEAHLFYCYAREEGRTCQTGWWPQNALAKAKSGGVTLDQYFPYTAGNQGCSLKSGWKDNLAKSSGHTKVSGRQAMKEWLINKGSLTGCFVVYQDFFSYKSGVYRHVSGGAAGGHCVEIIGYDDTLNCWVCKNSWGTGWGDNGFFKIGYGQCQIETWSGPYGANSVSLRQWEMNTKVRGLWANSSDRNAWVYLQGAGWKKVTTASEIAQKTQLTQLISAKAAARTVRVLHDNDQIEQLYVL
jgi:C1A family cysteine protease